MIHIFSCDNMKLRPLTPDPRLSRWLVFSGSPVIPPLSDELILLAVATVIPAAFLPLQRRRRQASGGADSLSSE